MKPEQMKKFNPDVFGLMQNKLARNHKGLKTFLEQKQKAVSQVFDFNTSEGIKHIEKETVDIVVTSPPYGDSRTTVAYGQFSRLANEWLDVKEANQVDNNLMGGRKQKQVCSFDSQILDESLDRITNADENAPKKCHHFIVITKILSKISRRR